MNIELVKQFTKDHLKGEKTGHDYYHGQRVANLATKMYLSDYPGAHKDSRIVAIIQTGSYLHDTIDEKICDNPDEVIKEIKVLLPNLQILCIVQENYRRFHHNCRHYLKNMFHKL